jgi:anti-sigma factor RsiW
MNEERFQELLADYIAGELDQQQTAAFRAELESNPERRRLARELQAAAAALEANDLSDQEARQRTESLSLSEIAARGADPTPETARPVRRLAALRYAAVIVLAFGAGFLARGWKSDVGEPPPPPTPATVTAPAINERYVAKYRQVMQAFPKSSSLSRSLLTLARR